MIADKCPESNGGGAGRGKDTEVKDVTVASPAIPGGPAVSLPPHPGGFWKDLGDVGDGSVCAGS